MKNKLTLFFILAVLLVSMVASATDSAPRPYRGAHASPDLNFYNSDEHSEHINHLLSFSTGHQFILRGKDFDDRFRGTIALYFPGSTGNYFAADALQMNAERHGHRNQLRFYSLQYPGYRGASAQDLVLRESNMVLAGRVAYQALRRAYPRARFVLVGFSLGSAISIETAEQVDGYDRVIVNSAWTSFHDACKDRLSYLPGARKPICANLSRNNRYATAQSIKNIKSDIVLRHGTEDTQLGIHHSQELQNTLSQSDFAHAVDFIPLHGIGHSLGNVDDLVHTILD